jgi:hypothetical protein
VHVDGEAVRAVDGYAKFNSPTTLGVLSFIEEIAPVRLMIVLMMM